MLHTNTIKFLKQLKKNNDKAWMDANRSSYLDAKADFENFTGGVLKLMAEKDPKLATLTVKDCVFRINRDVRFSANKAPYKTNMAMYFSTGGKKSNYAGYYCHIEPGSSFIAGGVWMPMAPELKKIRQEIDYNWQEFEGLITEKKFKAAFGDLQRAEGTVLSRPPKGYDETNPAIEYLKLKTFIASVPIDEKLLSDEGLTAFIVKHFEQMKSFIHFLNRGLDEA